MNESDFWNDQKNASKIIGECNSLKNILKELDFIENKIRICVDINAFNKLKNVLNNLLNRIEVLINE